jgi:hypothetical protein
MVLQHSQLAEFGSPEELMRKPDGIFASMVQQSGESALGGLVPSATLSAAFNSDVAFRKNKDDEVV